MSLGTANLLFTDENKEKAPCLLWIPVHSVGNCGVNHFFTCSHGPVNMQACAHIPKPPSPIPAQSDDV